jgi:hypothetical protein
VEVQMNIIMVMQIIFIGVSLILSWMIFGHQFTENILDFS